MNTAVSVRLPENLLKELDQLAQETERPRSFILKGVEPLEIDLQIALDEFGYWSDISRTRNTFSNNGAAAIKKPPEDVYREKNGANAHVSCP